MMHGASSLSNKRRPKSLIVGRGCVGRQYIWRAPCIAEIHCKHL